MEDKTKQKIRRNRTSNVTSPVPEDKKNAMLTYCPSIRIQAKMKNKFSTLLHTAKVYLYNVKE